MAYVNHGRWIADCPREWCNNAERVDHERLAAMGGQFRCTECLFEAPVAFPPHRDEIDAILALRPVPATRNWFPADHSLATRSGTPHGQSAVDLVEENNAYGVETRSP